jgi:hypothetical protein
VSRRELQAWGIRISLIVVIAFCFFTTTGKVIDRLSSLPSSTATASP